MERLFLVESSPARLALYAAAAELAAPGAICLDNLEALAPALAAEPAPALVLIGADAVPEAALRVARELRISAPTTACVLVAPRAGRSFVVRALNEAHVARCVVEDLGAGELAEILECVLTERRALLDAARGITLATPSADERHHQTLLGLTRVLDSDNGMHGIALQAVYACRLLLPARSVLVQLWDDDAVGGRVEASAGGEMAEELHHERIEVREARVGELVIDARGAAGERLDELQLRLLSLVTRNLAAAVGGVLERRALDRVLPASVLKPALRGR